MMKWADFPLPLTADEVRKMHTSHLIASLATLIHVGTTMRPGQGSTSQYGRDVDAGRARDRSKDPGAVMTPRWKVWVPRENNIPTLLLLRTGKAKGEPDYNESYDVESAGDTPHDIIAYAARLQGHTGPVVAKDFDNERWYSAYCEGGEVRDLIEIDANP